MAKLQSKNNSLDHMTASELQEFFYYHDDLDRARSFQDENLGEINLSRKGLSGSDFRGALFKPGQDLHEACLDGCFFGPTLEGYPRTVLRRVKLCKASLENAVLRDAVLVDCELQDAILTNADLSDCDCRGTDFSEAHMVGMDLENANLYRARFDKTRLQQNSLRGVLLQASQSRWEKWCESNNEQHNESTRLTQAHQIFMELKENFRSLGAYADASWSYRMERKMWRKMHWPSVAHKCFRSEFPQGRFRKLIFWGRHSVQFAADLFIETFTGYGESLALTLFWTVILNLMIFPLLYSLAGGVKLFGGDALNFTVSKQFVDLVRFSIGTFIQDYAGMEAHGDTVRSIQLFQEILGNVMLGFIGFILANKINQQ